MPSIADLTKEALDSTNAIDTTSIDEKIEIALACPCIADLRDGPCGQPFVSAFTCFIKSQHEEKGMDCIDHFKSFQECINKHPDHLETILGTSDGDGHSVRRVVGM